MRRLTARLVAAPRRMMIAYAGADRGRRSGVFWVTPTGFIPAQDQGYFLDRHPAAAGLLGSSAPTR